MRLVTPTRCAIQLGPAQCVWHWKRWPAQAGGASPSPLRAFGARGRRPNFSDSKYRLGFIVTFALLACLLVISAGRAQPAFPALTGRVVDEAGLLSSADKQALTQQLAALEAKSTDQLVVVTLKSLQGYEIADYGYRLGRAWGIGQGTRKDNGVLLIVVPSQRKVRIEVGRGLEPTLTDATSRLIIENRILPAFRRGDFSAGVLAGAKDIQDVLLGDLEGVKARAKGAKRPANAIKVDWFGLDDLRLFRRLFSLSVVAKARQPHRCRRARSGGAARGGKTAMIASGATIPVRAAVGRAVAGDGPAVGIRGGFSGGGGSFGGGGASGDW